MRRVARALLPFAALALALAAGAARPAAAQDARPVASWTLEGVSDRLCISYLVEPAIAARLLGSRFRPVIAAQAEGLHPALAGLVSREPTYGGWVPAEICLIEATRVVSGSNAADEGGKPVVLGYAGLLATPGQGGGQFIRGTMFSTSGRVRRLAGEELIHLDPLDYRKGTVPDATDERRTIRFGGATITWDGHAADTTSQGQGHSARLALEGKRSRALAAAITGAPEWERAVAGTLKIQGKSDFARGLIGSPIRMVGPISGGGSLVIDFTRR